jgi:hypothetical protein
MTDPDDGPATLTDDEITPHRFDSSVAASTDDVADTGDDSGDAADSTDSGDVADTGDDSGDVADTSDTGDDA